MSTIRLCSPDDIESGAAKRFDIDGVRIALVRIKDDFYAIGDRCSHADYSLSEGEVYEDACEIECWKHGSTFSLKTGEPQMLPATRPVPVYQVEVQGNDVMLTIAQGNVV